MEGWDVGDDPEPALRLLAGDIRGGNAGTEGSASLRSPIPTVCFPDLSVMFFEILGIINPYLISISSVSSIQVYPQVRAFSYTVHTVLSEMLEETRPRYCGNFPRKTKNPSLGREGVWAPSNRTIRNLYFNRNRDARKLG